MALLLIAIYLFPLLIAFILFLCFCLAVVTVEHQSMFPTLKHGDRVLALRWWPPRWFYQSQVVLVFPDRAPSSPIFVHRPPYIKRIVALGGETYQENGQGSQLWQIPPGHIFVRGDNRSQSIDSLSWGPIPLENVFGVVLLTLPRRLPFK